MLRCSCTRKKVRAHAHQSRQHSGGAPAAKTYIGHETFSCASYRTSQRGRAMELMHRPTSSLSLETVQFLLRNIAGDTLSCAPCMVSCTTQTGLSNHMPQGAAYGGCQQQRLSCFAAASISHLTHNIEPGWRPPCLQSLFL